MCMCVCGGVGEWVGAGEGGGGGGGLAEKKQKKKKKYNILSRDTELRCSSPKVIKLFSCSTQLSGKLVLLINLKLLKIPNSFFLNIADHENFSANKYENANYC